MIKNLILATMIVVAFVGCSKDSNPMGPGNGGNDDPPDTTDNTPATVVSTYPSSGASGVENVYSVNVTFSKEVDPSSVHTSSIRVKNHHNETVRFKVVEVDGRTVKFFVEDLEKNDPEVMRPGYRYSAEITSGIRDTSGRAVTPYTWEFTTEPYSVRLESVSASFTMMSDVATENGYVYASGVTEKDFGTWTFFVVKFNQEGLIDWYSEISESEIDNTGSHVAVHGDKVYSFTLDHGTSYLNVLDAATGSVISREQYNVHVASVEIAFDDQGMLYFVSGISELVKADENGTFVDQLSAGAFLYGPTTVIADGRIFTTAEFNSRDYRTLEFDPETMEVVGALEIDNSFIKNLCVSPDESRLYATGSNDNKEITSYVFDVAADSTFSVDIGSGERRDVVASNSNLFATIDTGTRYKVVGANDSGIMWETDLNRFAGEMVFSEDLNWVVLTFIPDIVEDKGTILKIHSLFVLDTGGRILVN